MLVSRVQISVIFTKYRACRLKELIISSSYKIKQISNHKNNNKNFHQLNFQKPLPIFLFAGQETNLTETIFAACSPHKKPVQYVSFGSPVRQILNGCWYFFKFIFQTPSKGNFQRMVTFPVLLNFSTDTLTELF